MVSWEGSTTGRTIGGGGKFGSIYFMHSLLLNPFKVATPSRPFLLGLGMLMQLPPRKTISSACSGSAEMTGWRHTFLCPTKNPSPKVSVVNVILLPFGTADCQLSSADMTLLSIRIHARPPFHAISLQAPSHSTPVFLPRMQIV